MVCVRKFLDSYGNPAFRIWALHEPFGRCAVVSPEPFFAISHLRFPLLAQIRLCQICLCQICARNLKTQGGNVTENPQSVGFSWEFWRAFQDKTANIYEIEIPI